ncbi:hypothetical protein B0H13DRAFT_2361006 [Mycena leptocephala]|nr:hypothetical protein B0H13DRAFT_2361006 [Mycena leptocephala]
MSTVTVPDIHLTIGAAQVGCLVAVGLSAVLSFQTFLYFQIFPNDSSRYKFLVFWIWLVDLAHTALICTAVWHYAIDNYGNPAATAVIHPGFAPNSIMTVNITFSVNMLCTQMILVVLPLMILVFENLQLLFDEDSQMAVSKGNLYFTIPIVRMLTLSSNTATYNIHRLSFASPVSRWLMSGYHIAKTFQNFLPHKAILIATLSVSACTELVIAGSRWYFLRCIREGYSMSHEAVDAVLVFTYDLVGSPITSALSPYLIPHIRSAVVVAAVTCFIAMPHYWIFTAFFFSIAKVSGNSLLATLNLRNWYRHRHVEPQARNIPMLPRGQFNDTQNPSLSIHVHKQATTIDQKPVLDDMPSDDARSECWFISSSCRASVHSVWLADLRFGRGLLF